MRSLLLVAICVIWYAQVYATPIAVNDTIYLTEDAQYNGNVGLNDFDTDGLALTFWPIGGEPNAPYWLILESNGDFSISLWPNEIGTFEYIYKACTSFGGQDCAFAIIVIVVESVNDPPSTFGLIQNNLIFCQNTARTLDVMSGTVDHEGDQIFLTSFEPSVGTVNFSANGLVVYSPQTDYVGPVLIAYSVCDNGTPVACVNSTVTWQIRSNEVIVTPTIIHPRCSGDANGRITLSPIGGISPYTFQWEDFPSLGSNVKSNIPAGVYEITVSSSGDCAPPVSVSIELFDPEPLTIVVDEMTIDCEGSEAIVSIEPSGSSGPYEIEWLDFSEDSMPSLAFPGEYSIRITSDLDCVLDTVIVLSELLCSYELIQIPQGASPNGDGFNDFFEIENLPLGLDVSLQIWNASGQVVYTNDRFRNNWDCRRSSDNQLVDQGTYFYRMEFTQDKKVFTGFVVIQY